MSETFILSVDDNESVRYVRTRILERAGLHVKEAGTGAAALRIMQEERPGLVLLDLNLPDISGWEVCRRIKAMPGAAAIPVLHISATAQDSAAQVAGLDAGAEAYLLEPVEPGVLVATVKALLRVHEMHKRMEAEVERRRQAEEALAARNRRLRLLSEVVGDLLSHDAPPEEFVTRLYKRFASELGLEVFFHFQVNGETQRLRLNACGGIPEDRAGQIEWLDFGQAVCGMVALRKEPVIAENIQNSDDPLCALIRSFGITAYVCHPLLANGRLLGTLSFGTRSRARFEPDEIELLHTLCDQVAVALQRRHLRARLQWQASLLDQVRNAVIATGLNGGITYWNKAAETMYGWKAEEVLGRSIADVTVPPGAAADAARVLAGVAETGYWEGELDVVRSDGAVLPAFVTDTLVRAPDGSPAGYVRVSIDLSEQKRAAEILRQSEEKYRRIVETAAEGLWIVNASGRTTFVNRRMAAMLNYTLEEMPGLCDSDLVFGSDVPEMHTHLDRHARGITEEFELRLRRKHGSAVWVMISASPMRDAAGNFAGSLRMVTDITERKRARGAVEANERKLRRLVESNIIGVLTADSERIVEANTVFLEMVGYTREDLLAGRLQWKDMTPPEYAELDSRALHEILSQGNCRPFEKEYYRKDGTRVPILIGGALLNDKPEWLCFALDLSGRKRAEEALREVQKFESLGFLAGGVAHNLNNILTGILGNVSLVLEAPELSPEDRMLLEDAVASTERAASLNSQLLAYAGKGKFTLTRIDLGTFVGGMTNLFRNSLSRRIDLRFQLDAPLLPVEADEEQMRQIVSNLVINAAEAIGDRPGTIEVATRIEDFDGEPEPAAFTAGRLTAGKYVVLKVSDTGSGMDETTRSRMFDPFFTTKFTGRGLGLAAVAGIVRSHGGAIQVSTAQGEGTTFEVFLPAAAADEARSEQAGDSV